jgi:hypothetical protein
MGTSDTIDTRALPLSGIGVGGASQFASCGATTGHSLTRSYRIDIALTGALAGDDALVNGLRIAFGNCSLQSYQEPDSQGTLYITATIAPHGEVTQVSSSAFDYSDGVKACVLAHVRTVMFASSGSSRTLRLHVTRTRT